MIGIQESIRGFTPPGRRCVGRRIARALISLALGTVTCVALLGGPNAFAQGDRQIPPGDMTSAIRELQMALDRWRVSVQQQPGFVVSGYISAAVSREQEGPRRRTIFVPGVDVVLEDLGAGSTSPPQSTDLSGRFTFHAVKPGKHQVCWKADGFAAGCRPFDVTAENIHLSETVMLAERRDRTTLVFGDVQLADGSRTRLLEPLAGINAYARVELLDPVNQTIAKAIVNNFGEYILPQVPVRTPVIVRARIEAGIGEQPIAPEAQLERAPAHEIDLTIGNRAPRLDTLAATDGSARRLQSAKPGATLQLIASVSDPDGDPLAHHWLVAAGSGSIVGSGTQASWTLPGSPGLYSVTLIVGDGRGGYAQSSVQVRTDQLGVPFSGTVEGTDTPTIDGAVVEVNGQQTVTAADGTFSFRVKDATRFVVNIRKSGYGLVSRIYDDAVMGGRWMMTRSTIVTVDPRAPIEVVDQRDRRNCPGPLFERLNWRGFPKLAEPQWQDGRGNVVAPFARFDFPLGNLLDPKQRDCGPGISVRIPPDALVDGNGQPPNALVQVSLTTIDLQSPEQMPGDYAVADAAGVAKRMESYGAGMVEVTARGRSYNLRPGAEAEITIPVDPGQLAAGAPLPAQIPYLTYDERRGIWVEEGSLTLQGNAYVGKVRHFSAENADLIFTNQACLRIKSPTLPPTYKLELQVPRPSAAPLIKQLQFTNTAPHVHTIYGLPPNTNVVLVPIRVNNSTPIGMFVVNTGGPQNPQSPYQPDFGSAPDYYPACSTEVVLTDPVAPPPAGEFLHGLTFQAVNLNDLAVSDPLLATQFGQATQAYYDQIDPRDKRLTLPGFRSTNGFPANEIAAPYANSGDLGFGREMHCTKQTASDGQEDVACYVTNYGSILTPDGQDAADAAAALNLPPGDPNLPNPVATVAMEWSRIESAPGSAVEFDDPQRVVKFYVYNSDGSALLSSADLDSGLNLRARPIPQLCMICHGGQFPTAASASGVPVFASRNDVKLGSQFLPFDLHYFTLAAPDAVGNPPTETKFRRLNQEIVQATQPVAAINDVIAGMYLADPTEQDPDFVITGWNGNPVHQTMYRDVVARACRTCHIANSFPALRFQTALQAISDPSNNARLGNIEQRVCVQGIMPHARRTHEIFWTANVVSSGDPYMPGILQLFGDTFGNASNGWNGQLCGEFTQGQPTPPSIYTLQVYPIFAAKGCTGCHLGATPPQGLNLLDSNKPTSDPLSTFPQLLQNAGQLATMGRITANDPAQSYLSHKVKNTQGTVGGGGQIMPPPSSGQTPLNATQTGTVDAWIAAGAPPP